MPEKVFKSANNNGEPEKHGSSGIASVPSLQKRRRISVRHEGGSGRVAANHVPAFGHHHRQFFREAGNRRRTLRGTFFVTNVCVRVTTINIDLTLLTR